MSECVSTAVRWTPARTHTSIPSQLTNPDAPLRLFPQQFTLFLLLWFIYFPILSLWRCSLSLKAVVAACSCFDVKQQRAAKLLIQTLFHCSSPRSFICLGCSECKHTLHADMRRSKTTRLKVFVWVTLSFPYSLPCIFNFALNSILPHFLADRGWLLSIIVTF